ncbi:hypothetical protein NE865_04718 [Phthorimaea operculella]|nr:hypothetical protein NE865_04718 [Phthorimaea operculella]
MACISAETGTLTFAIINLALSVLSTVGSIGLLIFWGYMVMSGQLTQRFQEQELFEAAYAAEAVLLFVLIFVVLTFSLVSMMFGSFLMNGILKKKPEHIKVYYIFGIVKIVMSLLFVIAAYATTSYYYIDLSSIAAVVLYYFVYALILYMIRRTYKQYETVNDQFSHKPLVEKC